jgi:beta-lactamase regulating signal transducer with metallopeptidase domain
MSTRSNFRVADRLVSAFSVYLWYNPAVHIVLVKFMF